MFLTDQFNNDLSRMEERAQTRFQEKLDDLIDRTWSRITDQEPGPVASS
jgi:hypothetical protein